MKKIILLLMLVFIGASTTIYAQESKSESRRAERKAQRDAIKAQEKIEEERAYADAVQAIKERKFVLEADRVTFKRGRSAFILLNGDRASVQIAFNGAFAGPNGIGGVTVDGTVGKVKVTTDKKGNVSCSFSVSGVGISAQVSIRLTNGGNRASATVNPNYNSNRLSLDGKLIPLSESNIFKGRSF